MSLVFSMAQRILFVFTLDVSPNKLTRNRFRRAIDKVWKWYQNQVHLVLWKIRLQIVWCGIQIAILSVFCRELNCVKNKFNVLPPFYRVGKLLKQARIWKSVIFSELKQKPHHTNFVLVTLRQTTSRSSETSFVDSLNWSMPL